MSFFKPPGITTEEPESIDFKNKRFYLSGNFATLKKDFGKKLVDAGATFKLSAFTLRDTDYFVLADKGITDRGKKKDHGEKAKRVQKHNNKLNQSRHIPIITESYCKKLLEEFTIRKGVKP